MASPTRGKPTSLAEADHRAGIRPFIEGLQVLGLFADADEADRHADFPDNRHLGTPAGGAIQLRNIQAREPNGLMENLGLLE